VRPQRQLIDHCPEDGRYGDCQRTCVAAILDLDASDVPHFCDVPHRPKGHRDWWEQRQNRWLAERGLATMTVAYSGDTATFDDVMEWTSRQSPTVPMIVCGRGGKGVNHVVVVLNGEIVCDPSGSGIVGPTLENTWEVQVLAATKGVVLAPYAGHSPDGGDAKQAPCASTSGRITSPINPEPHGLQHD
jgi:hypothetical protein